METTTITITNGNNNKKFPKWSAKWFGYWISIYITVAFELIIASYINLKVTEWHNKEEPITKEIYLNGEHIGTEVDGKCYAM